MYGGYGFFFKNISILHVFYVLFSFLLYRQKPHVYAGPRTVFYSFFHSKLITFTNFKRTDKFSECKASVGHVSTTTLHVPDYDILQFKMGNGHNFSPPKYECIRGGGEFFLKFVFKTRVKL